MSLPILRDPFDLVNSPSSINTWLLCQRKWAWDKIDKLPRTSGAAAELGTRCHVVWEEYLKTGEIDLTTKEGQIVQPTLVHLPMPGECTVEGQFWIETPQGFVTGIKDFDCSPEQRYDLELWGDILVEAPPLAGDHKSTGDKKWVKDLETLSTDAQVIIYGVDTLIKYGEPDYVDFIWSYSLTSKKKKAIPIRFRLSKEHLFTEWQRILMVDNGMRRAYATTSTALELPPSPSGCSAFGGCPRVSNCGLTAMELYKAMSAQSVKDKIAARKAARKAAQQNKASAPAAAPPAEEAAPAKPLSIKEKMAARKAKNAAPPTTEAQPEAAPVEDCPGTMTTGGGSATPAAASKRGPSTSSLDKRLTAVEADMQRINELEALVGSLIERLEGATAAAEVATADPEPEAALTSLAAFNAAVEALSEIEGTDFDTELAEAIAPLIELHEVVNS